MRLSYTGTLQLADMHSFWPLQQLPAVTLVDYLSTYAGSGQVGDNDNLRFDPIIGCAHASEVFVPHHQSVGDGSGSVVDLDMYLGGVSLPTFNWYGLTLTGTGSIQAFMDRSGYGNQILCAQAATPADAAGMAFACSTNPNPDIWPGCQGMLFLYNQGTATYQDSATNAYVALYFTINSLIFQVIVTRHDWASISVSLDGGMSYMALQKTSKIGTSIMEQVGNGARFRGFDMQAICVLCMSDKLMVSIGGGAAPFIIPITDYENPPNAAPNSIISNISISASYFTHFMWAVHPVKFQTGASMTSSPLPLGFFPSTPAVTMYPRYMIYDASQFYMAADGSAVTLAWPDNNTTVTVSTVNLATSTPQYSMSIESDSTGSYKGVDYCDFTPGITRILMIFDGVTQYSDAIIATIPLNGGQPDIGDVNGFPATVLPPKHIVENIWFDQTRMTIRHTCDITFTNFSGLEYLDSVTGIQGTGNIAVNLALGYTAFGEVQRFNGYCDSYEFDCLPGGVAFCTLHCTDWLTLLEEEFTSLPPNMDGWNHYYAMKTWLELAGITTDQMGFTEFIPDNPGDSTSADTNPFFLPIGPGNSPMTPINRTICIMDQTSQIQKMTGFVLYQDNAGLIQYRQWVPGGDGTPIRYFSDAGDDATDEEGDFVVGGALTEIQVLKFTSSTKDVRNVITFLGGNPFTQLQSGASLRDDASINSPVGSQPFNYVGFKKTMIWFDARWSLGEFAQEAIQYAYNLFRQPAYNYSLACWPQWDLFPLDIIGITEPKTALITEGLPLTIMSLRNEVGYLSGNLTQKSSMQARFIIPFVSNPNDNNPD